MWFKDVKTTVSHLSFDTSRLSPKSGKLRVSPFLREIRPFLLFLIRHRREKECKDVVVLRLYKGSG